MAADRRLLLSLSRKLRLKEDFVFRVDNPLAWLQLNRLLQNNAALQVKREQTELLVASLLCS